MGSPQWGQLILDGEAIEDDIAHESLIWSDDRRLLAAQHLVHAKEAPRTRVVVLDTERRIELAATPPTDGLSNPIRFDDDGFVYRQWHWRRGEQELRLALPSSVPGRLEKPAEKRE
jgi:hypothetical protein